MPRVSPDVERLTRECDQLRKDLARLRQDPGEVPLTACDSSCVVASPRGMTTNGGCRCDERTLRHAVGFWRGRSHYLQTVIDDMRSELARAKRDEVTRG